MYRWKVLNPSTLLHVSLCIHILEHRFFAHLGLSLCNIRRVLFPIFGEDHTVPKLIWICCIRIKPFTAIEQMQRYLSGFCARYSRFKQESDKGRLHPRHYSNPIKCSQRLTECFFCYFSYVFKNQAWKVLHPLLIQQFPDLVDKYEEGAEKRRSVQTASV